MNNPSICFSELSILSKYFERKNWLFEWSKQQQVTDSLVFHAWLRVWTNFSLIWESLVQLLSHVWLFATPGIAARQASLFITTSQSSPKLMSIELVMPFNHLILCRPLFLLPSIFPSIRVFSNESVLYIRWPKYWSFSFSIIPSNDHPGLISFRMDWLDLLAVQGTLKSLFQHHSSKASIFQRSAFFTVQFSHPYMTTGKTIALIRLTFVGNFSSKEQASFNFMAAVTICSDSGAPKIKSATVSTVSPSICHEVMGPDAMTLVFWMLSFFFLLFLLVGG